MLLGILCAWGGGIMNRSYLPKCLQDISAISKDKINYKCLCTLKNGHPHHPLYISYKKMKGLNSFDLNKYLESLPSMQSNMLLSADEIGSRVTNAQFVEFQEKIGVLKNLWRGNLHVDELLDLPMFSYKNLSLEEMYEGGSYQNNLKWSEELHHKLSQHSNPTPRTALGL